MESSWPFHFVDVNCSGFEMTLFDCPHNNLIDFYSCHSTRDASVRCHGKAPLCFPKPKLYKLKDFYNFVNLYS